MTKRKISILLVSLTGLITTGITTALIISRLSQPVSFKPKAVTTKNPDPLCRLVVDVSEWPIVPFCQSLTLNGKEENLIINQGESVNISASTNNYLVIRYGKVKQIGDRLISSDKSRTLIKGYSNVNFVFTPALSETGVFVFEVNAYESLNCRYLCSPGKILYEDWQKLGTPGCETGSHWNNIGSCQSTCIRWLTINPSL